MAEERVWVKVKATGSTIRVGQAFLKNPTFARSVEVVTPPEPEPVIPPNLKNKPLEEISEAIGAPADGLSDMKLPELRAYAKERGIEVTGTKKSDIIQQIESWQK
jgi:hypothetical protein